MNKEEIISRIEQIIMGQYEDWAIGVTDNAKERRVDHGDPGHWYDWNVDAGEKAQQIRKHFIELGCQRNDDDSADAKYIYIFFGCSPKSVQGL